MDKRKKIIVGVSIAVMATAVCISLGLSAAAQKMMIPDVTGLDWDDAEEALLDIGIEPRDIEFQRVDGEIISSDDFDEYIRNYIVIAQEPESGVTINLAKHDTIHLLVKADNE